MNWIDALLLIVVLFAIWSGWQHGFVGGALAILTWVGSFVAGYFLYPYCVAFIESFTNKLGIWIKPVSFIGIVIIARLLLNGISRFVMLQFEPEMHQHPINKLLGIFPGFANGLLQAIVIAALLLTIPVQNKISDTARESALANSAAPPAFWLEQKLAPVFSDALRNTLPKNATVPGPKEVVTLPFKNIKGKVRTDLESEMLELVNRERQKEGLKPLKADPEIQQVARVHSNDMLKRGYFAHINPDGKDPFDRMQAARVRFRTAGENLALAQTLQQAHKGLMNSPGHRANILKPHFGRLGIGIIDAGIYGLMVTQNFRN